MHLTPAEIQVIAELCQGNMAKQIAHRLSVDVRTVEKHIWNAKRRNTIKTTIQLCVIFTKGNYETANQSGMVSQPDDTMGTASTRWRNV